jgi:hypothetical protein
MAVAVPESTFVGIDLSARQIAQGRQVIGSRKSIRKSVTQ